MSRERKWVVCLKGRGRLIEDGKPEKRTTVFPDNSVGIAEDEKGDSVVVWLIGTDERWLVPANKVAPLDVTKTGDKHRKKICNVCHRLLSVGKFARNQNNLHGVIRRPSCIQCRTDIDKRAPKSGQAKRMEKDRPRKGDPFRCPICRRRSIVSVTAKVVADHDHSTGDIRDFICDSCNTGLGRFKNGENYLQNAIEYLRERDTLNMTE